MLTCFFSHFIQVHFIHALCSIYGCQRMVQVHWIGKGDFIVFVLVLVLVVVYFRYSICWKVMIFSTGHHTSIHNIWIHFLWCFGAPISNLHWIFFVHLSIIVLCIESKFWVNKLPFCSHIKRSGDICFRVPKTWNKCDFSHSGGGLQFKWLHRKWNRRYMFYIWANCSFTRYTSTTIFIYFVWKWLLQ